MCASCACFCVLYARATAHVPTALTDRFSQAVPTTQSLNLCSSQSRDNPVNVHVFISIKEMLRGQIPLVYLVNLQDIVRRQSSDALLAWIYLISRQCATTGLCAVLWGDYDCRLV